MRSLDYLLAEIRNMEAPDVRNKKPKPITLPSGCKLYQFPSRERHFVVQHPKR